MLEKKLSNSLFSLLRKMRLTVWEGANIRKLEEEIENESVLEKRREWRGGKESLSLQTASVETSTSPWLRGARAPRIRCNPVSMRAPAIFSTDVSQVTSVLLGQLPHSLEETFYYLPWNNCIKGYKDSTVFTNKKEKHF